MGLVLVSFLAGVLTILAPCILPLLPIILGASVQGESKWRPYIIIASLGFSILVFSLLLKASTLLIDIPQSFWTYFSATIVIAFGIITLFPDLWKSISTKLGLSDKSNQNLAKSSQKEGMTGAILIGFSLGPIFASCSPTYLLILSVILPASLVFGLVNLIAYIIGLSVILLGIALLGQRFT
ncbi:cytochrome c biogenesis protein DipZ, partial [Candidatus Gracilibacteria bacterium]|nr:cytochrome c biogenesis protein DipZ [Candidatus Gracilibacteria bacterium]